MMAVPSVHASPAIDNNVGAEAADHADHIFEDLVAPDPFGFLGGFRKAKIFGACKEKPHAVAACGRQQFLRADQSELRCLLWAKVVLATLAACQGKQRDVSMEPSGKIGEHSAALVVGMRRYAENPRGDASLLDGLDSF